MTTFTGSTAAAGLEPVSVETAKSFLRVDGNADDTLIGLLISAARERGEEISRLAFMTQECEMVLDAWPGANKVRLLRPPLQSVTSVTYISYEGVEAVWTDYVVDTQGDVGTLVFRSVPTTELKEKGAIRIEYTAGYGATSESVPRRIQMALLMLIAYWYENREASDVPDAIRQAFMAERLVWF